MTVPAKLRRRIPIRGSIRRIRPPHKKCRLPIRLHPPNLTDPNRLAMLVVTSSAAYRGSIVIRRSQRHREPVITSKLAAVRPRHRHSPFSRYRAIPILPPARKFCVRPHRVIVPVIAGPRSIVPQQRRRPSAHHRQRLHRRSGHQPHASDVAVVTTQARNDRKIRILRAGETRRAHRHRHHGMLVEIPKRHRMPIQRRQVLSPQRLPARCPPAIPRRATMRCMARQTSAPITVMRA